MFLRGAQVDAAMVPNQILLHAALCCFVYGGFVNLGAVRGYAAPAASWHSAVPSAGESAGVLLLVPGYNGSGETMLDERWRAFGEEHGLVVIAPTFRTTPEELRRGRGYYYPEQGSGAEVERMLGQVGRETGVATEKILIFGFSAGAHFSHRFALWKPERVKAFVACSAGWWSEPTAAMRGVPALIVCGEADRERFEPTKEFFERGLAMGLPWVWRSYAGVDHTLTPRMRDLAEAFLAAQLADHRRERLYGDTQTYRVVGGDEMDSILPEVRVALPSREFAEIWEKEE
ncbi:MAG: alpha/beta hydrolase [Terrimicrobiaceae bacterium]|nr:alpha/beta hydrolase [Terrimicrobiaceae bacterium]